MKNKKLVLIGGLLAALLVVAVIGATNVYAQDQGPTDAPQQGRGPGGRGPMGGAGLEAAAQALGMTTDELTTALQGGKTLEQIAQEKGVDFAKVQAAMQTARDTEMRARIQQALDDGKITQEHADWLLEGLDKGFLNGPGGFGMGFGGPHGPGRGDAPANGAQPTQEVGQ
ncbi:MAG TPA: hypothetical protein VLE49_02365 [Anaerolineales bacterium]|nr:hypothetical protein [Anaerolineales bacterium]